ncbi:MAG TPA: sulfatase [Sedimentisphaerales bacterium]|nr:sulfatase [Sedimentisphaerales bacterium]
MNRDVNAFRNNRRDFLKSLGVWAVSAALPDVTSVAKTNGNRYNVLLICVDDLRPQLGCFGHKEMISPNIDKLADEGRLFTRHYVQVAVCGPSRCSMLTGKRQGSWDCWTQLRTLKIEPDDPVSLPHLFRKNGYRTVCIGKVSHQPGGVIGKEAKVHQVPFSWDTAYAPVGPWKTPWGAFFSYDKGRIREYGYGRDDRTMPACEAADVPDTGYADGLNAEEAVKQLRALKDQNFFLAVGFYKPHLPFNAPKKYWDLYDPERIELAKNPFAPHNVDPAISLHPSFELTTHYDWPSGEGNVTPSQARMLRHAYFACVSYVDAQIGKVLDEVKRLGLDKNTVIALWSDHGWHLGEHAMWGKQTNFEIAVRSPFILKVPGMPEPGRRTHSLVETVDLYPTLAELCGLDAPDDLAGISLAPMILDPDHPGKALAYSFHPRGPLMGRTLRTGRYRIVHWTDKQGETVQVELYDHQTDPDENENVAAQHRKLVDELLLKLRKLQQGEQEEG